MFNIRDKKQRVSIFFSLFLIMVFFVNMYSSNVSASLGKSNNLYIIKQDGKYGYMDRDGKVVIKPMYLRAKDFAEGVAPVMMEDHNWGILNTKGEVLCIWKNVDEINEFSEGLAVVRQRVKYGYIDKKQLVIPIKFDNAYEFSEGMAAVAIREGNTLAERLNAKYGYIDKSGNLVIDYQFRAVGKFKEGLAPVSSATTGYSWGYIDKTGQYVLEAKYFVARDFSEGLAPVSQGLGKSGFIDHKGNFVIPPKYSWSYSFSEGIARVVVGDKIELNSNGMKVIEQGKYGYINNSGEFVIQPMFNYAEDFKEGLARVYDKHLGFGDDKYEGVSLGYIDKNGSIIRQLTK
ncbi:WG repeat-containing protein [Pelosinus fermentans]|uniref:KWG Leptospira repeat protein n=1 Tax=Pelosinus fermentans JBW45 TaxID=1192197 RepID=I9DCK9_9FIRM|nr:WG repeat-containing protein [Pelosinus fermentans]AJQ27547.1 KWG Leptospira repeat protein [Pelosinus fermentans JBW45]